MTPLTGRHFLKDREAPITPVSTATQSVSRLHSLLSGRKTCPGDTLIEIFKYVLVFVLFSLILSGLIFKFPEINSSNQIYIGRDVALLMMFYNFCVLSILFPTLHQGFKS